MSVDVNPQINADRITIRMPSPGEAESVLEYWLKNRDHLANSRPHYPDDFFTREFWRDELARNLEDFRSDRSMRMYVYEKDRKDRRKDRVDGPVIIGNVGLFEFVRKAAHFCYLGYGIDCQKEGLGYMSEAVAAVIRFGFEELNLHRIMANYQPANERSGRLLKRLGFTVEGYARDYLHINGQWRDHILTSKTNPAWKDGQA